MTVVDDRTRAIEQTRMARDEDFWRDLLPEAATLVVTSGLGSVQMLQRKMRLPHAVICDLMDELHDLGVVGPATVAATRQVLVGEDGLADVLARIASLAGEDEPEPAEPVAQEAPPPVSLVKAAPGPDEDDADWWEDDQPGAELELRPRHPLARLQYVTLAPNGPTRHLVTRARQATARQVVWVADQPMVARSLAVGRQVPRATWRLALATPRGSVRISVALVDWLRDARSAELLAKHAAAGEGESYAKVAKARLEADLATRHWLVATAATALVLLGLAWWAPAVFATVLAVTVFVGATCLAPRGDIKEWLAGLAFATGLAGACWWFGDDLAALIPQPPAWVWWVLGGVAVVACGLAGRTEDKPLMTMPATMASHKPPTITAPMVINALCALGNSKMKDPGDVRVLMDPHRAGPGVQIDMELPPSVTATWVMENREKLAAALRRNLGTVWPSVGPSHPGHLALFISDMPVTETEQEPWPLASSGPIDIFTPQPVFTDQLGRWVYLNLAYASWVVGAVPRMGKALALDTPVPTPSGWTTMGELRDGDRVFDEHGRVCRVVAAHAIRHDRPCYEVKFSDGSVIVADAEHLWEVETRSQRVHGSGSKVLTTADMLGKVRVEADQRLNYSVRVAGALDCPDAELPVGPYTLGAWLGDGTSVNASITVGVGGDSVIDGIRADGYQVTEHWSARASGRAPVYGIAGLAARLRTAGVLGDKHIPSIYFRASETQRRALLAGLLDTDGWCEKWGTVRFAVTSQRLAEDTRRLIATLGYVSTMRSRVARLDGRDCSTVWEVTFCPDQPVFRMARKAERQSTKGKASNRRRFIVDVRPAASVPVRCITVDSPSSLYLVGEQCIPTHNTFLVRELLLIYGMDPRVKVIALDGKGTGDLAPLIPFAHTHVRGARVDKPEGIETVRATVAWLLTEMGRRTDALASLPAEEVPDSKVTSQLVDDHPELDLAPIVFGLDETQSFFSYGFRRDKDHKEIREEIRDGVIELMRMGPAVGIWVIMATQTVRDSTIPSEAQAVAVYRYALKMEGWEPNDKVLGTGAFKSGIDATMFGFDEKGIGWLKGEGAKPQITRSVVGLDAVQSRAIAVRCRGWRVARGLLVGEANDDPGIVDAELVVDIVADADAAMAARHRQSAPYSEVVGWLQEMRPTQYPDLDVAELAARIRSAGVPVRSVWADGRSHKGVKLADLRERDIP